MTSFESRMLYTVVSHYLAFRNLAVILAVFYLLPACILELLGVETGLIVIVLVFAWFVTYCIASFIMGIMFFMKDQLSEFVNGNGYIDHKDK